MSLQFVLGASGSGKSTWLYQHISEEARKNKEKKYFILVPDQFTLETQKTMVEMSGTGGILNVDVLSFHRLAYRVFEEIPVLQKTVLEDMGKTMLLRKVFAEKKDELKYFKKGIYKPGFLDECKSFLCELVQYAIRDEELEELQKQAGESLLGYKLQDIRLLYQAFHEKMGDTYMMAEELVPQLTSVIRSVDLLKDAVICLDGFTGFTPTQYELLGEVLKICDRMMVTVTTDRTEKRTAVFDMSYDTMRRMSQLAEQVPTVIEEPVYTGDGKEKIPYRLMNSESLTFLEENIFSYEGKKWEGERSDIYVKACEKETEEAAYVARTIYWLSKQEGYAYEDFAVVTSDLTAYEGVLRREMDRLGIRHFVDAKKNIGTNAIAEFITSFMEMHRKNMDYESTLRFLRGGLSPLETEEVDCLENYIIARGKRGLYSYQKEWNYEVKPLDLNDINRYRVQFLDAIEDSYKAIGNGKKTIEEYTKILYELIVKNQIFDKLKKKGNAFEEEGKELLAREYKRVYRQMMDLLDQMVELMGDQVVTFAEYEEILLAGIEQGLMGFVPPTSNQVMIGDVERSRLKNIKVLFFVGVDDGRIPKGQGGPGILSEQERKKIEESGVELAPNAWKRACTEQFYFYLMLTKPSEKLFLTYSKMGGDGSSKRPAYLIQKVRQMFGQQTQREEQPYEEMLGTDKGRHYFIEGLKDDAYAEDSGWWELAAYYKRKNPEIFNQLIQAKMDEKKSTKLSKDVAQLLYGDELYGSITRLEKFAQCPYAHFLSYGVGLKEREHYEVGRIDLGNLLHKGMEHFTHRMEEEGTDWQTISVEHAKELTAECIEMAVKEYAGEKMYQSKRVSFMIRKIKSLLEQTVWGLWNHMQAGDFVQTNTELEFSSKDHLEALDIDLEQGKKLKLHGKIDRVDTWDEGDTRKIKIVDYKSGKSELYLDKVYHGLQLQLMTYMAASMELSKRQCPEKDVIPAAILYCEFSDPELPWENEAVEQTRIRRLEEMKCRGYVNDDEECILGLDHGMKDGDHLGINKKSSILPIKTGKEEGTFDKKSHIMSTKQFEDLMMHVRNKMKEFGTRIYEGEISATPYQLKDNNGCEYCGLKGVCGMDHKNFAGRARIFTSMTEEEVWEEVSQKDDNVDEGSGEDHTDEKF